MAPTQRALGLLALAATLLVGSTHALNKSSGCGKVLPSGTKQGGTGESNDHTITSDGIKRKYALHIPKSYKPTTPAGLIFAFHGRTDVAWDVENVSKFSDPTINPDMLVVYPNGTKKEWQGDPDATTNDVLLVLDLIANITSEYCIDNDKIYAAGKSNGGGLSANVLACDPVASTKIAAFAGFSGAYYQGNSSDNCNNDTVPIPCTPGRLPIPIFETHGSADTVIPYLGGPRRSRCLPTIPHFMTAWAERNGLGTANVTKSMYNGNVRQYTWGESRHVPGINTHYWINGLGHNWPVGGSTYLNGTATVMEFFNRWSLDKTPHRPSQAPVSHALSSPAKPTTFSSVVAMTSKPNSKSTASISASVPSATAPLVVSAGNGPACPAANGTTYKTDAASSYLVLCGYDTTAAVFGPVTYPGSLGACIAACDRTSGCQHVAYNGACYLKKAAKPTTFQTGNKVNRVAVKST